MASLPRRSTRQRQGTRGAGRKQESGHRGSDPGCSQSLAPLLWVYEAGGFPQLSPMPGQFLAKDILLLAAAVWVVGDSLAATGRRNRTSERADAPVP